MDRAIHLNNHSGRVTVEIGDESFNHLLSAKVQTFELIPTETLPQSAFRGREPSAKLFGTDDLLYRDSLTDDDVSKGWRV